MTNADSGHRLAAILSADLVGYSRLVADDERATARRWNAARAEIRATVEAHGGRLVDSTGDNLLAEFPSALACVRAALAIQRRLSEQEAELPEPQRLCLRIGVHLGDVHEQGGQLFGIGIHVAARLEPFAPPGGVCVSQAVRDEIGARLGVSFTDLGRLRLKNVEQPVRAYRVEGVEARPALRKTRRRHRWLQAVAALACLVFALWIGRSFLVGLALDALGLSSRAIDLRLPDRPSIAVLPLANMSGDPRNEYFADGMTEDLTTALSRVPTLFVISRSSAFEYKNVALDVERVGRELGVRYLLEGSVRRDGEHVRINAQLIDAITGFHVWAEQFDREIDDLFALQSEIVEKIVSSMRAEIADAELRRIRRTPTRNLRAYDLHLQAVHHYLRFQRDENEKAIGLCERALALDPTFADAHATLAAAVATRHSLGWRYDPSLLEDAEHHVRQAIELEPELADAYGTLAFIRLTQGRAAEAVEAAERFAELDPSNEIAHGLLSGTLAQQGRFREAMDSYRRSLRMSPRPNVFAFQAEGYFNLGIGRPEEALRLWEAARQRNPEILTVMIPLAWLHATQGREDEARGVVAQIRRVNPDLDAAQAVALLPVGDQLSDADARAMQTVLQTLGLPAGGG